MIRVLVVDDSAFIRTAIRYMLRDENIEVVGTAKNGLEAIKKTIELKPDIITLDIKMPVMDGLTALKKIMEIRPTPVIMLSALTKDGAKETIEALRIGAVDFITKPKALTDICSISKELIKKIKTVASSTPNLIRLQNLKKYKGGVVRGRFNRCEDKDICILIGSSTGGPSALEHIIPRFPSDLPASVFVVQHMPPNFTKQLADRLNSISEIRVKEAENNERVKKGVVYIAPGGKHMKVKRIFDKIVRIKIVDGKPVNAVKPSIDVTAESIVQTYGGNTIGVILTGMGCDGAYGMKLIKDHGGFTIACSEDTCVVSAMPKAAIELGAIDSVKPLYEITDEIIRFLEVKCDGR